MVFCNQYLLDKKKKRVVAVVASPRDPVDPVDQRREAKTAALEGDPTRCGPPSDVGLWHPSTKNR